MTQYSWKAGVPAPKVEAQVFGQELERIADANGGIAAPEAIVEAAQKPGSPIADAFTWDDASAAHQYRLAQARRWTASLVIVRVDIRQGRNATTRGFHSVSTPSGRGYASEAKIVGDKDLRRQVVQGAARDLKAMVARFRAAAALGAFVPRLQGVLDDVEREIEHLTIDAKPRETDQVKPIEQERPAA